MTAKDIVWTIFEIAGAALLLYGVLHKEKLIRFENRVILVVKALWIARKATRVVPAARAGQITRMKPETQNRGAYCNVSRACARSNTERNVRR